MELKASWRLQEAARYLAACVLALMCLAPGRTQETGWKVEESRKHGFKMLKVVKEQIERNYYDKTFHGVDLDARFKLAEEKISQATTSGQVFGIIAQAVVDLNDSHTRVVS